jgi:glutaminyl-peptide cyclotransferase
MGQLGGTESALMSWSRCKSILWGVIFVAAIASLVIMANVGGLSQLAPKGKLTLNAIPFDGERAYKHLNAICAIGPRIAGTKGMREQQELVTRHFEALDAIVKLQEFDVRHPETGEPTKIANLIAEFHPDRKERVLLCAHYDTRPFPDEDPDPKMRRAPFVGANDGASGVAVLMELGTHLKDLPGPLGIDIVLFDAEELVYDRRRDPYFIGSNHFAHNYVAEPPGHKYRCGVLLDMVGDKELQIFQEKNSYYKKDVAPIVRDIWATAAKLGVSEFIARRQHEVQDDHLPLNNIAKIPTCDIIDFDYPRPGRVNYWHTTKDVPENCSALSLAKVGWVVHEWLKQQK